MSVPLGTPLVGVLYRHRRVIYLAAAALALLGGMALTRLSSGIYPDVAFPRISIVAEAGEDSVENVEISITRPMEQAVSVVPGVRRVHSKTLRGACEMKIDFEPSTDMRQALGETRARIASLQSVLPPDLHLTVEREMPSLFPVISFHVTLDEKGAWLGKEPTGSAGFRNVADLNDWAVLQLKPRLARLPDVFLITVQSADVHEVVVEVDPAALDARGIGVGDVADAVDKANKVGAVGRVDRGGKRFQVLVTGQFRTIEDVESVAIPAAGGRVVRLGDVAHVKEDVADRTAVVTGDGRDAVVVNVFMRAGGRVIALSRNVTDVLEEQKKLIPPGVLVTPVYDQAELVQDSLAGCRDAILLGGVLSVVILFAFLRDARATLIAAPSIPLAIIGTFAFMSPLGLTLNLMSLGGVAIAIGLVVDDAIVVVECIARHLALGKEPLEAVDTAVREVAGAVIGSSLTTIVVFLPLVLLEGVSGQFMKALSWTLSIAILLSLAISLILIPIFALGPLGPRARKDHSEGSELAALHDRAATWLIAHRKLSWLGLALALALAWFVGDPGNHSGYLPQMDEGSFVLDHDAPVGTSLPEVDTYVRRIEEILKAKHPEIRAYSRRTGMELGFYATEPWKGDFLISLKPRGKGRTLTGDEIGDKLGDEIGSAVPQLHVEATQLMQDTLNDMMGNPAPIEVKIFGRDHRALADAVERARGRMLALVKKKVLSSVSRGMSFGSPELFYRVDSVAAARRGFSTDDVEKETRASLLGIQTTTIRWGERLVPVRIRWPDAFRDDERWIAGIPLVHDGKTVPLSLVAAHEERFNPNELQRENQQPVATVEARLTAGTSLGEGTAAVKGVLEGLPLPEGSHIAYGGQTEASEELFQSLYVVLILAVSAVLVLLVAQFRSFGRALVIFLALPFSQVGGLIALRLCDIPINLSSFMGLIMLVGLVVKNGILLVDHTDRLREEGMPLEDALVRAGSVRLRPILMTSLTAIAGLLPLALNLGSGAELQRPLAVAVIGGLSLSTVFTLAVVPLGMLVFARRAPETT
jgi:CzcA family heavy metal efflux pump